MTDDMLCHSSDPIFIFILLLSELKKAIAQNRAAKEVLAALDKDNVRRTYISLVCAVG